MATTPEDETKRDLGYITLRLTVEKGQTQRVVELDLSPVEVMEDELVRLELFLKPALTTLFHVPVRQRGTFARALSEPDRLPPR